MFAAIFVELFGRISMPGSKRTPSVAEELEEDLDNEAFGYTLTQLQQQHIVAVDEFVSEG